MKLITILVIVTAIVLTVSSCTTTTSTPSLTPTPVPTSTAADQTVSQFADSGKTVFARRCGLCHGTQGQGGSGPTLIGANSSLKKFNTAQGLLNYINNAMPATAPGSLSPQEYLQVLAFLLVENNYTSASASFDSNILSDLALTR